MGDKKEKTQKKSFFKGLQAEFKKIIWPDKETLAKQTTAVVIVSVLLGAMISIIDVILKYGIDLIVHLGRLSDRSRRVLEITELCGMKDGEIILSPLYQLQGEEGSWQLVQTGVLKNQKKLEMAGMELPMGQA